MTVTTIPTIEQVIAEVRRLADEKPDFVYPRPPGGSCKYTPDNEQPGCIFGQALSALGWRFALPEIEGHGIAGALQRLNIDTPPRQTRWCAEVQIAQDGGQPWGEAVQLADAKRPL